MSDRDIDAIARQAAETLTDIDPDLPAHVDAALKPGPTYRLVDPISLGALLVSVAGLGWQIYHDLKQDRASAKLGRREQTQRLAASLRDDPDLSVRLQTLSPAHQTRLITVVADQTVEADASPTTL